MNFSKIKKGQIVKYRGQEYIVCFLNKLKHRNTVSLGQRQPDYNGVFVMKDNAAPEELELISEGSN